MNGVICQSMYNDNHLDRKICVEQQLLLVAACDWTENKNVCRIDCGLQSVAAYLSAKDRLECGEAADLMPEPIYLGRMVVLVHDYDEAIHFYTHQLGFQVLVDIQAEDYRFVHLVLPDSAGIGVWFMLADTEEKRQRVGNQTGGEPLAVLYTDNFPGTRELLTSRGVKFLGEPHEEPDSISIHFQDLYGNIFVLVELT